MVNNLNIINVNQKIVIIANWKCNPSTEREAENLLREIKKGIKKIRNTEVIIVPPFVYLPVVRDKILLKSKEGIWKVGAQNCFWENSGAFTGEISPLMLKELGVEYVILGHSERRIYFGETDEVIAKKLKAILENKLSPILCIGETKEGREEKKIEKVLKRQLKEILSPISHFSLPTSDLVIAYEPIWAIGTGDFCSPDEAKKALLFIKKELIEILPRYLSQNIRIIYGGSVDSENAKNYINIGFKGLLIGGASLIPQEFIKIVNSCNLQ